MLVRARNLITTGGHLFLVLPLACVDNSRYFTEERLFEIANSIGFEYVLSQRTAKLAMYMFEAGEKKQGERKEFKREVLRQGEDRNNFAIVVKYDDGCMDPLLGASCHF
jgi:25S rRNA (adenine2142-N1)-methyltransferase